MASLTEGDRVELEWLQIKIEMDTDIEEHKFGMVEQCQKLLKLDAATEEALIKQYPQPELLLPKVAPKAKGEEKAALEAKFGKLVTWYDNEAGYSSKCLDLISHMDASK